MKQHPPNGPYDGWECDLLKCPCHPASIWKHVKNFLQWWWREFCIAAATMHGYPPKKELSEHDLSCSCFHAREKLRKGGVDPWEFNSSRDCPKCSAEIDRMSHKWMVTLRRKKERRMSAPSEHCYEDGTKKIQCQPQTWDEVDEMFAVLKAKYREGGGESLRAELVSALHGARLVIVFDWEDM